MVGGCGVWRAGDNDGCADVVGGNWRGCGCGCGHCGGHGLGVLATACGR